MLIDYIIMSKDKKKDKKNYEQVKEQWIQMDEIKPAQSLNLIKKDQRQESNEYPQLIQQKQVKREGNGPKESSNKKKVDKPIGKYVFQQLQPQFRQEYYPKTLSRIVREIEAFQKEAKLTNDVKVTCDFCTVVQLVPGNAQVYICGSCENMNECYPLYGIFICGNCQSKVGFGFGTSEHIKCPKCSTICSVPLEAKKTYQSFGGFEPKKQKEKPKESRDLQQFYQEQQRVHRFQKQEDFYD